MAFQLPSCAPCLMLGHMGSECEGGLVEDQPAQSAASTQPYRAGAAGSKEGGNSKAVTPRTIPISQPVFHFPIVRLYRLPLSASKRHLLAIVKKPN